MILQEAVNYIRNVSININELYELNFNHREDFIRLSENIQYGKLNIEYNSVRFILANILDINRQPRNLNYAGYFELIVIGDFENEVRLVERVAESLTNFYIDTEILPRIRPINEIYFSENILKYDSLLKKTTKLYDREENIF